MLFDEINLNKAVLVEVNFPGITNKQKVYMLRLDLIHPEVHGNKWFKLKYNISYAKENGYNSLLTFGGAYSNHIRATAAAGKLLDIKTIGIIRGEEHLPLNPTLEYAFQNGMDIRYVSRSEYRQKHTSEFQNKMKERFGNIYIIPEGGTNLFAVKGCREIPQLIKEDYDYLCTACGTAGTLSGIVCVLNGNKKVLGFSVLKGGGFLRDNARNLIQEFNKNKLDNWDINLDYHFGGYAKIKYELINFINEFEKVNGIILDPVYTGKMMYGIFDLMRKGFFKNEEKIIALHTGGQQGIAGMRAKINRITLLQNRFE